MFSTVNPATGEVIGEYGFFSRQDVATLLEKSVGEYHSWRYRPLEARIECVRRLAKVFRNSCEQWAALITLETGKPITEARAEIEKCAWACEVYADYVPGWLADEQVKVDGKLHKVVYQPLGVILSIMPWNFPFWQVLRFAIPTLLCGNSALLRHSNMVPQCARAIEDAFQQAGFPADLFRTLLIDNDTTEKLIESDMVRGVAFTGSTQVGAKIAQIAGRSLTKVVLELGGSDPFIVLDDADVRAAASSAVVGRFGNCGQSCVSSKRFIVHEAVAEEFIELFVEQVNNLVVGDPEDPSTQMGPLVSKKALLDIERQYQDALVKGATILTGGYSKRKNGFYFNPTVITDVTPDMAVICEETFGPLAAIICVGDESEAVRKANDTEFGLGASIWTQDLVRGERLAAQVDAGTVFVNSITKSDPRMPFGGTKNSGLGRELSKFGLMEFVNIKGVNLYELPR